MALARDPATYGGRGGSSFDDGKLNVNIVGVRTVKIRSGNQVDSIQVRPREEKNSLFVLRT